MTGALRFEIYRVPTVSLLSRLRGRGDWRWQFCGSDGSIVARSGGYPSHQACLAAVDALRRRASVAAIVGVDPPVEQGAEAGSPAGRTI
ncbi:MULTISPECIES: YegP family protein [unclassified Sphingomonas]|uniref:YegP family protein n=1 Tax=unclassified Sphingomonas TaxID=196159 RepID=UPI0006FD81C6|nr:MULTISPECIES: YegP family protein [unclassified Sphingomonas]KQX26102.1 hypothetical protein ASD17_01160 [Sphingomonas sp. Root1294]KQY69169.1 hypothetical protein ASD39_02355 [Sphingomonas sp. Root50]KRB89424.1 hypothetical protein ASE22_17270 [Sphingomonas sp. Root720]